MKKAITALCLLILHFAVTAQEFQLHENQLIYDPATMNRLGVIVDSLNLKFKSCDLAHPYYGFPQGTATYIRLDHNIKKAKASLQQNITPEAFKKMFPQAALKKQINIMRYSATDYREKKYIYYSSLPDREGDRYTITLPAKKESIKNSGWVIEESDVALEAFYIDDLQATMIPHNYARLIQYVDCMIDTTAQIFLENASRSVRYTSIDTSSSAIEFIQWANNFAGEPEPPEYDYNEDDSEETQQRRQDAYMHYYKEHKDWDSLRMLDLDKRMNVALYKRELLMKACNEALKTGESNDELELYVARYLSKEQALQLKRSRRVIGGCSMDQSPRYHAMSICMLAAQTARWDIFLRSHLDIMNDRFDRVSDGSWAWAERKTYLRELEALDIQATDLLLGTCLRTESVGDKHYFGDIGRIGRALSETSNHGLVEKQMFDMITDPSLDLFNRLLIAFLYDNYSYNLSDEEARKSNAARLKEAVKTLPADLRDRFKE